MTHDTPKDGDFASLVDGDQNKPVAGRPAAKPVQGLPARPKQTIEDVLVHGEEPTAEFLEEFGEVAGAPPVSDDELDRQAVEHPGADGDASTPE